MKEKFNKFIHGRFFIAVLLVIFASISLLVGTYAWFTWSSTNNTKLVLSIGSMADVTFSSGNVINSGLTPVLNYNDGISTNFNINNRDKSGAIISYNINLNITTIDSELISKDVKWTLVKNGNVVKEGNLFGTSNNSTVPLYSGALSTGTTSYEFYLYIDGSVENDPNMMGKTITGNIMVEVQEGGVNLLNHINNLYIENYDSSKDITFADGTGMNYYAPEVSLMNDGLDSAGAMTNNPYNGNVRYYGSDPDNYIYFNCSDYSDTSTCEVWRIIGIVDGKVKIMKNEYIGNYAYDDSSNNWNESSIKELLNSGSYFTSIQSKNSNTEKLISESTWYTNGVEFLYNYMDGLYKLERTGTSTWNGNIALIYPSDYGYSGDLNGCNNSTTGCNSWMNNVFSANISVGSYSDSMYWLISPLMDDNYYAWFYWAGGFERRHGVDNQYGIVPTLYLDQELTITKGNGSSEKPYQIYVEVKADENSTHISNFAYVLGSDTPILSEFEYDGDIMKFPDIELDDDEVLLIKYIGEDVNVNVPDTYIVDGIEYNVTMLSYGYYSYYDEVNMYEGEIGVFFVNNVIETVFLADNIKLIEYSYTSNGWSTPSSSLVENSASYLFPYCDNLKYVKGMPSSVTSMIGTFQGCKNLITVPEIPSSVTNISWTFNGCTSLVTAPKIPSSVTDMSWTFSGCTSLTGTVRIDSSNVSNVSYVFGNTSKPITVEVPGGSTTYTNISALTTTNGMPSNVTLSTFTTN